MSPVQKVIITIAYSTHHRGMRWRVRQCLAVTYVFVVATLVHVYTLVHTQTRALDDDQSWTTHAYNGSIRDAVLSLFTASFDLSSSSKADAEVLSITHRRRVEQLGEHLRRTVLTSYASTDANYGEFVDELVTGDGDIDDDRILKQMTFKVPIDERTRKIYVPSAARFGAQYGKHEFLRKQCPMYNCEIVSAAINADAVVFYQAIDRKRTKKVPQSQLWIFYSLESPAYTPSLEFFNDTINYTATYRWDSDLVTPYERWTHVEEIADESERARTIADLRRRHVDVDYAVGKTKEVAWFASHCNTQSGRERFVKQLKNHVSVDVFGRCGKMKCARSSRLCEQMLSDDYHFYLAFENSLCSDYMTEKFFRNALMNNVVPIVMGASLAEYERASPPHSFIHVDQFDSVASLATHLTYLMRNATAYNAYLAWKSTYTMVDTKFWCRLCALVNAPRRKTYVDMDTWWRGGVKTCTTGNHTVYW